MSLKAILCRHWHSKVLTKNKNQYNVVLKIYTAVSMCVALGSYTFTDVT